MQNTLPQWAPLLCGAMILVLFGGMIALLITMHRRSTSPAGQQHLMDTATAWLNQVRPTLVPWDDSMLTDISTAASVQRRQTVAERVYGTISSAQTGRPLLAFYAMQWVHRRLVLACTSRSTLRLALEQGTLHIEVDGVPLGTWQRATGTLIDARGMEIGRAQAPTPITINRLPTTVDDLTYLVHLHGRPCASILAQAGLRRIRPGGPAILPAVTLHGPLQHPSEATWLLALAAFEGAQRSR